MTGTGHNRCRLRHTFTGGRGHPGQLLTSKVDADHPHLTMRPRAWIDPANVTGNPATARDGTVVQLRPLRRDERELVARFFAGLSRATSSCLASP
jgi:hypothetical protein